jgi:stage II sporulation protein R
MKLFEKSLCLALALTVLLSFTGFAAGCEDIPDHVLRLHVLANSDSKEDQALKLKVRDRILKESAKMMDGVKNRADAEKAAAAHLTQLREAAEDEVKKQGSRYPVQVELTHMYFTTRQYDEVTLPAGNYDALRVVIGSGKGHNWWCVIFPPMCLPAAEKEEELRDVLNRNEMRIVDGKSSYVLKFKTVEVYEQLKEWMEKK